MDFSFLKDFPLYESFFKFHWKLKRNPSFLDFSFLDGFSSIRIPFKTSLEIKEKSFVHGFFPFWKDFPLYESLFKFHYKLKRNPSFLDFSFLKDFPLYESFFKFHWKLKRNPSFLDFFHFWKDFPLYEFLLKLH